MLAYVALPTSEISGMKAAHLKMMSVLLSFSDRGGKCWPSIRTLAARAAETVGWVQRNLREMASLEDADGKPRYFKRSRRFGSYVYEISARLLPRVTRQRVSSDAGAEPESFHRNSQAYSQGGDSPASRKENPRSKIQDFKNLGGDLGREAPSEAEKAEVSQLLDETLHRRPLAARVADEAAYAAAVAREKRDRWLRGIGGWIGQRLKGQAALEAWEVIDQAQKAGSRAATPTPIRRVLDRLDKLYRQEVGERRAAQAAAKVQARAVSKSHLRRKWGHYQ